MVFLFSMFFFFLHNSFFRDFHIPGMGIDEGGKRVERRDVTWHRHLEKKARAVNPARARTFMFVLIRNGVALWCSSKIKVKNTRFHLEKC